MQDCIFCKIVKKELTAEIVNETDNFVVFKDAKPSAPIHLLIVPKTHIDDIRSVSDDLWIEVKKIALELAQSGGHSGFRISNNAGEVAMVKHFHVHFMAGITAERSV